MKTSIFLRVTCMALLASLAMLTACSTASLSHYKSRDHANTPQQPDNLQALIDQTSNDATLRIPRGTYIINNSLIIKGRTGLTIIAQTGTAIILTDADKDVLVIEDSKQIRLYNVLLRHATPLGDGRCQGGVIRIDNAKDITIANSEISGCAAVGISAQNTQGLIVEHCYIHNNSFNALYLSDINNLRLWSNVIVNNANTLQLYGVTDLQMSDNIISQNTGYWRSPVHQPGLLEWSPNVFEEPVNDK